MKTIKMPYFNQDGGAAGGTTGDNNPPQTVKIGDQEYTVEQLQTKLSDYAKLEKQHTKVTQENSDLRKTADAAKEWLEFDKVVSSLPADKQQQFIQQTNAFFAAVQSGNVTQQDVSGINKAITAAQKAGDNKTADALEGARDEAMQTLWLSEQFDELEDRAEQDGIEFKQREFKKFFTKYLEDEGYDEGEEFGKREIRAAYKLYVADKKEKAAESERKNNLPNLGTGGTGITAGKNQNDKGPKTLKEATERALKMLGG